MAEIVGTVLIAQGGRIQVMEDSGAGHLFILSPSAATDTSQLHALQAGQSRVRVTYTTPSNVIGLVASRIEVLEPTP